jgi:hypothetical protein
MILLSMILPERLLEVEPRNTLKTQKPDKITFNEQFPRFGKYNLNDLNEE